MVKSPDLEALKAVAKAAKKVDEGTADLRLAVREARAQGIPLRTIADYAQRSHEQVRRLAAD